MSPVLKRQQFSNALISPLNSQYFPHGGNFPPVKKKQNETLMLTLTLTPTPTQSLVETGPPRNLDGVKFIWSHRCSILICHPFDYCKRRYVVLGLSNSSYKLILQIISEIRYPYQKITCRVGQIIHHVGISYFDLVYIWKLLLRSFDPPLVTLSCRFLLDSLFLDDHAGLQLFDSFKECRTC